MTTYQLGSLKTKRFLRALLARSVESRGYRVSGNMVFTAADMEAIRRGAWRASVDERPAGHPAAVVRAANLLQLTFSR